MDLLTQVLLNIFNLSVGVPAAPAGSSLHQVALRLPRIDTMLSRLVGALAPPRAVQFQQALNPPLTAALSDPAQGAELISLAESVLQGVSINMDRLGQIAQSLDAIVLLDASIRLEAINDITIQIDHGLFFDYISELRYQSPVTRGHVALLGYIDQPLQVTSFTNPSILQNIGLRYYTTEAWPELWFHNLESRREPERAIFVPFRTQDDKEASDLKIYRPHESKPRIQVQTRTLSDSQVISAGHIYMSLSRLNDCRLIATTMYDLTAPNATNTAQVCIYIRPFSALGA